MHFQQVFLGSHRPFSALHVFGCDAERSLKVNVLKLCTRASRAASYTSSYVVIWHVVSFGQNGTYRPLLQHSQNSAKIQRKLSIIGYTVQRNIFRSIERQQ